jgi:hypothetical protein
VPILRAASSAESKSPRRLSADRKAVNELLSSCTLAIVDPRCLGAVTIGLSAFVGHEIEFESSNSSGSAPVEKNQPLAICPTVPQGAVE